MSTEIIEIFRSCHVPDSAGISKDTVKRFICRTPAVELSYLTQQEQQNLLETMESEDCTPSLSQAVQLKKLSQSGELNLDKIFEILREPKANQQEKNQLPGGGFTEILP